MIVEDLGTYGMHQCVLCRNAIEGGYRSCAAFPAGIPDEIVFRDFDHRLPFPGDNGIRFEPMAGRVHPLEQSSAGRAEIS